MSSNSRGGFVDELDDDLVGGVDLDVKMQDLDDLVRVLNDDESESNEEDKKKKQKVVQQNGGQLSGIRNGDEWDDD